MSSIPLLVFIQTILVPAISARRRLDQFVLHILSPGIIQNDPATPHQVWKARVHLYILQIPTRVMAQFTHPKVSTCP